MLYFAQRIEEMYYHYAIDIYKAPVLNTHLLAKEYISTLINIENGVMNSSYLQYIMEEFKNSLQNDIILKKYWGIENILQFTQALNSSNLDKQGKLIHYLYDMLSHYKYYNWCVSYLKDIIPEQNEKKKIEQVMRCLFPDLIAYGYAPEFVYNFNRKTFFADTPIESTDGLLLFFKRFDFKPHNFKIYLGISKEIVKFKSIMTNHLNVTFNDDGNFKFLKIHSNYIKIFLGEIKALDRYSAMKVAYNRINLFLRFYKVLGNINDINIQTIGMAIEDNDTTPYYLPAIPLGYDTIEEFDKERIGNVAEITISELLLNAENSIRTLIKAVDLHNDAISERNLRDGFLNLWSSLEVLCQTKKTDSKIDSIIKTLVPILEKDYFRGVFDDIQNDLSKVLSKQDFDHVINSIEYGTDNAEKIANLILLDSYKALRNDIYSKLSYYPVLRSRIFNLSAECTTPKKMYKLCEHYGKRVSWHIRRMYRTRNAIVHAGETPQNLKMLGEHLHSYVDSLIIEFIYELSSIKFLNSIDNVLIDTEFSINRFYKIFDDYSNIDNNFVDKLLNSSIQR